MVIINKSPSDLYGTAIKHCIIREDGTMWVDNEEYSTQVNFNPWTGEPAPNQMISSISQHVYDEGIKCVIWK